MKFGKTPGETTNRHVGSYWLSKAADDDLMGIALFGDEHFGIDRSNRYRDQLKQRFSVLAEQPLLYVPCGKPHSAGLQAQCVWGTFNLLSNRWRECGNHEDSL